MIEESSGDVVYTSTWSACWHNKNNTFFTAKIWLFKKQYVFCWDCGRVIERKTYDRMNPNRKASNV